MSNNNRILLFSYAFPPMQVQMTAAVFKPMAAIASLGYEVDVICADSFSPDLGMDDSLLPYAKDSFRNIIRLNPSTRLIDRLQRKYHVFSDIPDLMAGLHRCAYEQLMDMDLSQYDAVMTWSPFHSINPVMVQVKKERKNVRWIAQFSDPWSENPLEVSRLTKIWNRRHEPRTVEAADFIIHSSRYSLDLMLQNHPEELKKKTDVLPHVFNEDLYPQRPKIKNDKIIMRYVGVLYGRRSPETLFQALNQLFKRRKDLKGLLTVELVGIVPLEMMTTESAHLLPEGTLKSIPNVSYIESLELMYDADILLLIDADVRQNLFLPSKLSDYIGANTPIVGLVPPGGSEDALKALGVWHARPSDIDGIAKALEGAIDHVTSNSLSPWYDASFRDTFSGGYVANKFVKIIKDIQ